MDSVQEQETKKQKLDQPTEVEGTVAEPVQAEEKAVEEQEEEAQYSEEDLKLGHELIAAVIANDLVKYRNDSRQREQND